MKLLFITTIREYEKHIPALFKKAGITAYSSTDIRGYNTLETENPMDNWFSSMDENLQSSIFFTFTSPKLIDVMLEHIEEFNKQVEGQNPMHGVVMGIEKYV